MAINVKGLMDVGGSNEGKVERSFNVTYNSIASRPPDSDTEVDVTAAVALVSGIVIGSPWKNDPFSFCRSIRTKVLRRRDNPLTPTWEWTTVLEFATVKYPKITMRTDEYEKPVSKDVLGNLVTNSAQDRVFRTKKRARTIFRWERYVAAWNWQWNQEHEQGGFRFTRNQDVWDPFGRFYDGLMERISFRSGTARIDNITADPVWDFGGAVLVTMDVSVDSLDNFQDRFIDEGFFYHDGITEYVPGTGDVPSTDTRHRHRFTDGNGFASRPQLLNGHGRPLPAGQAPVDVLYQYYPLDDWSEMGFFE